MCIRDSLGGFARLGVDEHQVRNVDRSLLLEDTALGILRIGLGGLLDDVHTLDDGTLLRNLDLQEDVYKRQK